MACPPNVSLLNFVNEINGNGFSFYRMVKHLLLESALCVSHLYIFLSLILLPSYDKSFILLIVLIFKELFLVKAFRFLSKLMNVALLA